MPKAGWCTECKKYVWVKQDGSCQFGHPASSVTNLYEAQPKKQTISQSDIEKHLEDIYIPMLQEAMGVSPSEAKTTFRDLLSQIKQESEEGGTADLPDNYGDILLERAKTDEETKRMLAKARKEGVGDEDIRWWWNMHDLERRMMLKIDDLFIMGAAIAAGAEGKTIEQTTQQIDKMYARYGDPDDTSVRFGEDRPLPFELKDRINMYVEKRGMNDPETFKEELERSSSFNALIRREIKAGNV